MPDVEHVWIQINRRRGTAREREGNAWSCHLFCRRAGWFNCHLSPAATNCTLWDCHSFSFTVYTSFTDCHPPPETIMIGTLESHQSKWHRPVVKKEFDKQKIRPNAFTVVDAKRQSVASMMQKQSHEKKFLHEQWSKQICFALRKAYGIMQHVCRPLAVADTGPITLAVRLFVSARPRLSAKTVQKISLWVERSLTVITVRLLATFCRNVMFYERRYLQHNQNLFRQNTGTLTTWYLATH